MKGNIVKSKNKDNLYPEYNWSVSIEKRILTSTDWDEKIVILDLNEINRFYVRTTNKGPYNCDVWFGIETESQLIEIPQGAKGEDQLLDFTESLQGFELNGMNSAKNETFECWKKGS